MEAEKNQYNKQLIKKQVKILSGFFPTFLCFVIKQNETIQNVQKATEHVIRQNNIPFQKIIQPHLTITRTISVLQSQIKIFVQKIRKLVKNSHIKLPIILLFKKVINLQNFVCIQVEKVTHDKLTQITNLFKDLIPNPYFQKPIYHISIFKILTKIDQNMVQIFQSIKIQPKISYLLQKLIIKSGSKVYQVQCQ